MGCAISCSLFEKFATFIHLLGQSKSRLDTLDKYLDDFLFAGAPLTNNCQILMESFTKMCQELGVPIADKKTVGPSTLITFVGLVIDTLRMIVKIPEDKFEKLEFGILLILNSKKLKVKEFESIIGLMAFCAKAIRSARAFMRGFYDVLFSMKFKKPFYSIRMNQ